jgi:hypothetical protein
MAVKHGQFTRVFADRFDITGDMNEVTWGVDRPTADVTAFSDAAKQFIPGQHSWKAEIKGWHDSQGTVSAAGSAQPDGTAGSDLALYYLGNLGTAPPLMNKVLGFFPEGCGTGKFGYAGIGGVTNIGRTANLGGGVGITSSWQGTSQFTHVTCIYSGLVTAQGSTGAIDLGSIDAVVRGLNAPMCFVWFLGTMSNGGDVGSVYGTLKMSDVIAADAGWTSTNDALKFSGTAAMAMARMGTMSAGTVQRYYDVHYSIANAAAGTIVVAVGQVY